MSMRSLTSPRRIYVRAGLPIVCFSGVYFGPGKSTSKIDPNKEVRLEVQPASHGKKRVQVTQKVGKNPEVVETWLEQHITFEKRAS